MAAAARAGAPARPTGSSDLAAVEAAIRARGFTPRGGFHPAAGDAVPALTAGRPAATLVLIGNAGAQMWRAFCAARDPDRDLLDEWSAQAIGELASALGARALFPLDRPPLPFLRWAQRAEGCTASPLGIHIHPVYGLWHGYRGALAFAEHIELPHAASGTPPCAACADKPCLSACPVHAFTARGYDVAACTAHLAARGDACMSGGCLARRACPIGRDYRYAPAQARFHMAHFLRAHAPPAPD